MIFIELPDRKDWEDSSRDSTVGEFGQQPHPLPHTSSKAFEISKAITLEICLLSSVSRLPGILIVKTSAVDLEEKKIILFVSREIVFVVEFLVEVSFKKFANDPKGANGMIL